MKQETAEYKETLRKIVDIVRELRGSRKEYPSGINSDGKRALYDNLGNDETLALRTYIAIKENAEVGFRENPLRLRALKKALSKVEGLSEDKIELVLNIAKNNPEFWCR